MKKLAIVLFLMAFFVGSAFAAQSTYTFPMPPQPADSSAAPDDFGYTWVDNDNGGSPVYQWIDISHDGVAVEGLADDNAVGPFQIGFDFSFYWYTVDHFYIGSNGYISFDSDANYSQAFPMIPDYHQPNNLVVPLACDIDFTAPYGLNECYYYTNNTDTLIVSWINVNEWNSPYVQGATHTFQLILCATDSSITYQYGEQGGNFMNTEGHMQIGIEDLVGQNGLRYVFDLAPPDRMPHDGLAIRIHAEPDPTFVFDDVGVAGAMNETSGGVFVPTDQPVTLGAWVKNYGTQAEADFNFNCRIYKRFTRIYDDTITVGQVEPGETVWMEFPETFTPDIDSVYSVVFRTLMSGDDFTANNIDTCEMRSYTMPATLTYVDVFGTYTSWQGGGGGFANEFVAPQGLTITAISADILSDGTAGYYFIMPADELGNPDEGNILWADTVSIADTGWVNVPVQQEITFNEGDKFFAAILSGGVNISFGVDQSQPHSHRGWENTGTYATSRDRAIQDVSIAVVCEGTVGIDDQAGSLPLDFGLKQNYPNPFNANTEITFDLTKSGQVSLAVYNIVGQEIKQLVNGNLPAGNHSVIWNGTTNSGESVSSGVYFYRLDAADKTQTKKMVLLK